MAQNTQQQKLPETKLASVRSPGNNLKDGKSPETQATERVKDAISDIGGEESAASTTTVSNAKEDTAKATDELYRERMEDEYAKREGGA